MKQKAKTIVVAIMATCALALAVWTIFGKRIMASLSAPRPAAAVLPAAKKDTTPEAAHADGTPPTGTARVVPKEAIDVAYIQANLPRWMESPSRDPFAIYEPPAATPKGPRAADVLSLRAIWRQTGGQLAVINGSVLAEGDRVAGFLVEAIEQNRVRVRGSNGVEQIEFLAGRPRVAPTNAPAGRGPTTAATTTRPRPLSP